MPLGISAGTASLIGAGVSAGAGILGGIMQSNTASKAAAQAQKQFEQQRADLAPYRTAGLAPLQAQTDLLGLNGQPAADAAMADYQTSPGYQWQLQQGLRATDAGAAARGMLRSGATLKAEQTFGAGLANSDFTSYYNRLMGLTTLGENAAAGGASTANQAGASALNAGTAQSSIYGNTASGLANTANNLFNNQAFLSMISPSSSYGNAAPGTPGISASGNPVMTGFAPAYSPGQAGVGGFVAPTASSFS